MIRKASKLGTRLMYGAAAFVVAASCGAAEAKSQISIPSQPLADALTDFAQQSHERILAAPELTIRKTSTAVAGADNSAAALEQILAGTGLTFRKQGDTFLIVRMEPRLSSTSASFIASETVTGSAIEGLVVTAQKRREAVQDVPIAISAFSADALQAQKIEGGFDLLKAIPNVTFSKNNFTSYNFSIRGIGTKAVSATTDPGVAVAFNSTGLIVNRLFEQEYFDIERVEVLRGPQGTLYGRNATAGVINVISQKANLDAFSGSIKGEVGNYHTKRLSGFVNIPLIEDVLALRFAGSLTSREGYDFNSVTDHAVNGRDLWSGRLTASFEPVENIHADLIWERFSEDDDRSRTGKQLCHRDPGPAMIGDRVMDDGTQFLLGGRVLYSQGCKPGSLYDDGAFGTPNGLALPFVSGLLSVTSGLFPIGNGPDGNVLTLLQNRDPYGGLMQSRDLREIASFRDPIYRANADIIELNVDWDITENLTFTSQTAYNNDEVYSFQDYNRFNTQPVFADTSVLTTQWKPLAPGGVFCDPQLGCSNTLAGFDISTGKSEQFSQEFRLQSAYDGPINFSVGANYTRFTTLVDYYVFYNLISAFALIAPFYYAYSSPSPVDPAICPNSGFFGADGVSAPMGASNIQPCPYIDPNPIESINGEGHNYFRSKNPYKLTSGSAFGELYWKATDTVKFTAGLRYTDDKKVFTPVPTQLLLAPSILAGGYVSKGYPAEPDLVQKWGELTGRLGVDWKPDLGFTDETLLYAFYSRGYKGGGMNPPGLGFGTAAKLVEFGVLDQATADGLSFILPLLRLTAVDYGPTFEPEFVNAFELGSKNTLFGGSMTFNTTAFYYDYKDYQVSQIKDRTAVNENFDATLWGLEFETLFAPSEHLQIVFNLGYLDTKIADGERSIDIMNRTQSNPDYIVVKPWVQLPSNCVVPTVIAEQYPNGAGGGWSDLCGGIPGGTVLFDWADYPELNGGAGVKQELGGNELPNSPHWTVNLGVQYSWDVLGDEWRATVRGDAYWQAQSWARVYNADQYDKLHGWYNTNIAFWIEKPEADLKFEFYVKNILDDTPITDSFLNSDDTALTTNVFTLDPRLIGVQITKGF